MTDVAPQLDLSTGAWKREYFEAQLARAVAASHRSKLPMAMIQLDVDDLQEHNDVHGTEPLDSSLSEIAQQLSQVLNGRGPIARLSGGAFATYLPGFTLDHALSVAEDIRRSIPVTEHSSPTGKYRLTVSLGVAALRPAEPWGNLMEAAEIACRKAKQGGKDTIVHR